MTSEPDDAPLFSLCLIYFNSVGFDFVEDQYHNSILLLLHILTSPLNINKANMTFNTEVLASITGNLLLFSLVFGMSSTVQIDNMKRQLSNTNAILVGLFCQFFLLPALGFMVVKLFKMDHATGVTLLVITSSPGGSYSNWYVFAIRALRDDVFCDASQLHSFVCDASPFSSGGVPCSMEI